MAQPSLDPPRPELAATPAEFVAALRVLRLWSGLTYRQLTAKARASGDHLAVSTLASALSRSTLPRREVVAGFVRACGLDERAVAEWVATRDALLAASGQAIDQETAAPGRQLPTELDSPRRAAPSMLPPDIRDFTGRATHLKALRDLLARQPAGEDRPDVQVTAAISGMGGIGKTALALHVAHALCTAFPDGQLWIDLRDAEGSPLDPGDVLARFLRAFGVDPRAIPDGQSERAEIYRTLLAHRRVLVVLDNASSERQIRPLLPGAATCAVLVTSRLRMTGIEGAWHLELGQFTTDEAIQLLARITNDERILPDYEKATEIAEYCGGLPLAVRIAGARLAARPAWRLAHLAAMLGDERRRLDRLTTGDLAVRASLALSYRELDGESRRLFRLLACFDVPDLPAWLAAAVLDCPFEQAAEHVETLVDAQLLAVAGTDPAGQIRYVYHDLVRLFAVECAAAEESEEASAQALVRGLGTWVTLAERMAPAIPGPCFALIASPVPRPPVDWADDYLADIDPLSWFDAERAAMVSASRQACRLSLDDLAFDLAGRLEKYFDLRGMYADWASLNIEVMAVCRRTGNQLGEAVMLRGLLDVKTWTAGPGDGTAMARLHSESARLLATFDALGQDQGSSDAAVMCSWALTAAGSYPEAVAMGERALRLATRSGHLGGEARGHLALAVATFEQGQFEAATTHTAAALDRARKLGNSRWEATALQFAGIGHRELGNFDHSQRLLSESLRISRAYRDNYTATLTLLALARLYFKRGDPKARETAEMSLALGRDYHMTHHLAEAFQLLGEIELAGDCPMRAVPHLEESVALWRTRGWPSFQAAALTSLGQARLHSDQRAARVAFEEAHTIFVRLGNIDKAAELKALIGSVESSSADRETAVF
ncbi:AfsR family transcriptional regulator [Micromonospora craterilacus]|uniref:AfsR family transcriptional regulator n=1 Tax=Micromonospora craterilacus TaxID=1655439 RepID=A0A2W2F7F9_9ACTN|nr:NB-ARC domain-containing protein [Micromonospora craterilacus]PZG21570.1 AfsR family transcriptional regulator [Micromonospora craterilacus]